MRKVRGIRSDKTGLRELDMECVGSKCLGNSSAWYGVAGVQGIIVAGVHSGTIGFMDESQQTYVYKLSLSCRPYKGSSPFADAENCST